VVTASRTETALTDVLADVSVIDRESIERFGGGSLRDVLASQPGLQISANGSLASATSVFIRGARGNQALVLIDGVPVGSATSGNTSIETIPLAQIERIEVLRGPAGALYGPNAVGGVIQIFTRQGQKGTQASLDMGVGSFGLVQGSSHVGAGTESFRASAGLSIARADGISTINSAANPNFNSDRDGFSRLNGSLQLRWKLGSAHELSTSVLRSEQTYGFDGRPSPNPGSVPSSGFTARNIGEVNSLSAQWRAQWTPDWRTTLRLGQSEDRSTSEYRLVSTGLSVNPARFDTQRSIALLQSDLRLGRDNLAFILERNADQVDSTTAFSVTERSIQSAVASYSLRRGAFDALATLRQDRNSQFGSATTHAVSAGFRVSPEWRVVGSFGTSFQAPTFNQLYFPNFGNSALRPQEGSNIELGLRYAKGVHQSSLTVFDNTIQGFINPATNAQSNRVELQGATWAGASMVGTVRVSGSIDYLRARDPGASIQRLVRLAPWVVNLRAERPFGWGLGFVQASWVDQREDTPANFAPGRVVLDAYTLVDIGARVDLNKEWSVLLRLNNALDERYALATTFSMPGRNAFVGVTYRPRR
jgi:vitamin B12 transporter